MDGQQERRLDAAKKPPLVFFSVGEPSGDVHAANLIRAMRERRPDLQAIGYGGPQMKAAGCVLHADLMSLAVMWIVRVILNLHKFWGLLAQADRTFRNQRPDAVVLVDYPGFNWWVARRAKAHGIPVFYYCAPQIWAWARWRVGKMRRLIDHVLCTLPFEPDWLDAHSIRATWVGHPFFDEVRRHEYDNAFLAEQRAKPGRIVALLPGSRTQEVAGNFRTFINAARKIHDRAPDVRFATACFRPHHAELVRSVLAEEDPEQKLPIEVHVQKTAELMSLAHSCLAVSGSVSLELLYHTRPTVIHYRIARWAYQVQKVLRKVRYITLVNLLNAKDPWNPDISPYDPASEQDARVLFPEYLTSGDRSDDLAGHVIQWLTEPAVYQQRVAELERLKKEVAIPGASQRAAEYIVARLPDRPAKALKPHYDPAMERASVRSQER